ncbi:MAG: PilN domain-containing protein [Lysobacteraceae bacterium]
MPASSSIADRLSVPLHRARARYARSPLRRFLNWWGGELATLLPASWRALFAEAQARVLYVVTADALEIHIEDSGRDLLLRSIALEQSDVDLAAQVDAALGASRVERARWLLLPGGQVLRRTIPLPAAAIERLRDVVIHEIDRQTPFRTDQVCFDCRVLDVDATSKIAQVELLVLPKDKLEAALAPLGGLADRLSGVDARDATSRDQPGQPLQCNLLPLERRQRRDRRAQWLHLGLAAFALIALLFALTQMLDNRSAAVVRLEAIAAARHDQARVVGALKQQLEDATEGANFLARARAEKPPMLALLADMSARIPDNTYLERFSEQDGQLYLTGLSSDPAGLVAKLQASSLLRTPALSGSVQPDATSKLLRFTLAAQLVGTPAAGVKPDAATRSGAAQSGAPNASSQR